MSAREILAAFLSQKAARMRAIGRANAYDNPDTARFFEIAATRSLPDGTPTIELHALVSGGRVVATLGGLAQADRFCGMLLSYDADPEISRCSPGQLLVLETIRDLTARGFATFDLGVGEARYKDENCEADEPLFDSAVAVSAIGSLFAAAALLERRIKRWTKQTPWARELAEALRRRVFSCEAAPARAEPLSRAAPAAGRAVRAGRKRAVRRQAARSTRARSSSTRKPRTSPASAPIACRSVGERVAQARRRRDHNRRVHEVDRRQRGLGAPVGGVDHDEGIGGGERAKRFVEAVARDRAGPGGNDVEVGRQVAVDDLGKGRFARQQFGEAESASDRPAHRDPARRRTSPASRRDRQGWRVRGR